MEYFENETTELKREWNKDKCLREIVAFLNTRDGAIYIGVNDDGTIYGVNNLEKTLSEIKDCIADMILPSTESLYELSSKFINGKHIIVINIKKGNKLYYIKKYGRSSQGCFYRDGVICSSMSESEIEKRFQASIPKVELKDIPTNHNHLSFKTLKYFLTSNGYSINEKNFLKIYDLQTTDNKYNFLAWMLSDENQTPLIVSIFAGIDKTNFVQRKDFGSRSLLASVKDVIDYFEAIK